MFNEMVRSRIKSEWLEGINKFNTLEMIQQKCRSNGKGELSLGRNSSLKFFQPTPTLRELLILLEIEKNGNVTQMSLARKVGLVPAQINNYIRDFRDRGLVETRGENRRKTTYHLTKKGASLKKDLLFSYMEEIVKLYSEIKGEFSDRLSSFYQEGMRDIVIYGAGEIGELICGEACQAGLEVKAIVDSDPARQGHEFLGMVVTSPTSVANFHPDGIVIASLSHFDQIYAEIKALEDEGTKVRGIG